MLIINNKIYRVILLILYYMDKLLDKNAEDNLDKKDKIKETTINIDDKVDEQLDDIVFIDEITVNTNKEKIYYYTNNDDSDNNKEYLCDFQKLKNTNIDNINDNSNDNIEYSCEVYENLVELKNKLIQITEDNYYRISIKEKDNKLIFYVNINTNITDDVIIHKVNINNINDDEFINQINDNIYYNIIENKYKFDTLDLFINRLDDPKIDNPAINNQEIYTRKIQEPIECIKNNTNIQYNKYDESYSKFLKSQWDFIYSESNPDKYTQMIFDYFIIYPLFYSLLIIHLIISFIFFTIYKILYFSYFISIIISNYLYTIYKYYNGNINRYNYKKLFDM